MGEENYPLKDITQKIIGAAFKIHNKLDSGFQEKVYQNSMVEELKNIGLDVEKEKKLQVVFGGKPVGDFSADLLVRKEIIVELKAKQSIEKSDEAQLINYLKASGIEIGLLINFGSSVQIKRKINTYK